MTLQAMPIAAQILSPGYRAQRVGGELVAVDDLAEVAKSSFRFNLQVASELYWRGKQNDYHLGSDFGSLRLPYPECWMEWEMPATVVIHGKEAPAPMNLRFAAGVSETEVDKDRFTITTQLMMQTPPHPVTLVEDIGDMIQVDRMGNYVPDSRRYMYSNRIDRSEVRPLANQIAAHLNVVYLAVNLINCKNVTTSEAGHIPVRRSGAAKRRKEPKLDYHTIVLPGMQSGSGSAAANLDVMPLHRVRGHFKTFTPERPLLGKYTGTYWWGWQVRGNKKNGVTVTDYNLAAS